MSSSSSFPSVVPQPCSTVPVLAEFLRGEEGHCRVWLRAEMNQIHDKLMDSLFHGQNGSLSLSSSSSAVPQHRQTVLELCGLLEGKKVETSKVMRDEMDQLVNSLFEGLTNKLRAYSDLDRSEDDAGDDRAQVDNQLDRVESPINAEQPPKSPFKPRLFTELEIKTELEFGNVDEFFAELGLSTGGQQQQQTRPAAVQLAASEGGQEESSSVVDVQIGTTPSAHLTRQSQANIVKSARLAKQKRQVPQVRNEVTNRDNLHVEGDEETGQIDEVSSRHVKRPRMDTTPREEGDQMESGQEPIGEESATQSTTDPVQPNLTQPNRRLQCPQCPKSFDHQSKLKRHVRVHTGERPFHCDQCDQRFAFKQNLDTHLLIHSGERPFECRHCEKSFITSTSRNKHEQAIHLQVKSYRCKQCALTATQRSNIITHIRVVHFGLPPTIKQQHELNMVDERDPRELIEKV